jgi:Putative prokaryotic signal transducing protein
MAWITVHKSKNSIEADLLVNTLESKGIGAVVVNKQISAYPFIGFVEVKVLEEFKVQAEEMIAEVL